MKKLAHSITSSLGVHVTRNPPAIVSGSEEVLGSYAPYDLAFEIGSPARYCLHDSYQSRTEPAYYDDTGNSDAWQDEVYRFARELADRDGLTSIADVGCGSGFKLMKYFSDRVTIGLDVPQTVEKLQQKYPGKHWAVCDFQTLPTETPDLVISSDVIEHLPDPDALLGFVGRMRPKWFVLSTPDRTLLRFGRHNGPPINPTHLREWSMPQFHAYVSHYFEIVDHFISNPSQATQCVLAKPR